MSTSDKIRQFDNLILALNKIIFGEGDVSLDGSTKPTIDKFLKSIAANGWYGEPFPTESALLQSIPTESRAVAKALDTKKVWFWDGTVWVDTGLSEKDLAIAHADLIANDLKKDLSKKYSILMDFHSNENLNDDFLLLNKNLEIIFSPNSNFEKVNKKSEFYYDFYSNVDTPEIFYMSKDLYIVSEQKTAEAVKTSLFGNFDFFTEINSPDLIYLSKDGYVLDSNKNETDIASNEAEAKDLYVESETVKKLRDFPDFYHQDNLYFNDTIALHSAYDELMFQHPNHMTMRVLGVDEWGNELREYTINPPKIVNWDLPAAERKPPKILMCAGMHGSEGTGIIGNYSFIFNLLNNWKEYNHYDLLRMNYQFIVIPVACPSGFNARTRGNANGVDLNRNFDADWSQAGSSDPTNAFYYGTSAASELETQILQQWSIDHKNAILAIDHHHAMESHYFWFGSESINGRKICFNALARVSSYLQKQVKPSESNIALDNLGRVSINGAGTWMRYIQNLGTLSVLCESRFPSSDSIIGRDWFKTRKLSERCILEICNILHENYSQIQL